MPSNHVTHVYIGLGGEGEYIGDGGLYRRAHNEDEWTSISSGLGTCLLYTSPSPRDLSTSRMPSSA